MKAVICTGYGKVEDLKIVDVARPRPGTGQLLVRVSATTVQTADWRIQAMKMPAGMGMLARLVLGLCKPRRAILGTEVAGVIQSAATDVVGFGPGDEVMVALGTLFGGHAEFVVVPANGAVARKPAAFGFAEAASVPFGGLTALHFLKYTARLQAGESILVRGASGAAGHACVQIARFLGADVTAICSSSSADFVRQLGAARALDYRSADLAHVSEQFDVVVDAFGDLTPAEGLRLLKPDGRLVLLSAGLMDMILGLVRNQFSARKILTGTAPDTHERLCELIKLVEQGAYRPSIDSVYRMSQIREAYRRVASRNKKGSIVIIPDDGG